MEYVGYIIELQAGRLKPRFTRFFIYLMCFTWRVIIIILNVPIYTQLNRCSGLGFPCLPLYHIIILYLRVFKNPLNFRKYYKHCTNLSFWSLNNIIAFWFHIIIVCIHIPPTYICSCESMFFLSNSKTDCMQICNVRWELFCKHGYEFTTVIFRTRPKYQ